jgi:hypothetical protein
MFLFRIVQHLTFSGIVKQKQKMGLFMKARIGSPLAEGGDQISDIDGGPYPHSAHRIPLPSQMCEPFISLLAPIGTGESAQ